VALPCLPNLGYLVIKRDRAAALAGADRPGDVDGDLLHWGALGVHCHGPGGASASRGLAAVHFPPGCVAAAPGGLLWHRGSVRLPRSAVRNATGKEPVSFCRGGDLRLHEDCRSCSACGSGPVSPPRAWREQRPSDGVQPLAQCLALVRLYGYRSTAEARPGRHLRRTSLALCFECPRPADWSGPGRWVHLTQITRPTSVSGTGIPGWGLCDCQRIDYDMSFFDLALDNVVMEPKCERMEPGSAFTALPTYHYGLAAAKASRPPRHPTIGPSRQPERFSTRPHPKNPPAARLGLVNPPLPVATSRLNSFGLNHLDKYTVIRGASCNELNELHLDATAEVRTDQYNRLLHGSVDVP